MAYADRGSSRTHRLDPGGVGACALLLILVALVLGCSGSGQFLSTDFEVEVGAKVTQQLEDQYTLLDDATMQARVDGVGNRLVAVQERSDITYRFNIVDDPTLNAFAVPGGWVYVTRGVLDETGTNDDQLAGVLGHEVRHVTARHAMDRLATGLAVQAGIDIFAPSRQDIEAASTIVMGLVTSQYSQADEFEADAGGLVYAREAGYDGRGLIEFLQILQGLEDEAGAQSDVIGELFSSHPATSERVARLQQQLATLEGAAQ